MVFTTLPRPPVLRQTQRPQRGVRVHGERSVRWAGAVDPLRGCPRPRRCRHTDFLQQPVPALNYLRAFFFFSCATGLCFPLTRQVGSTWKRAFPSEQPLATAWLEVVFRSFSPLVPWLGWLKHFTWALGVAAAELSFSHSVSELLWLCPLY